MNIAYAITAAAFAMLFLGSVITFGGELSRNVAIFAAFLGCVSQFTAQDPASYRLSIHSAYWTFIAAIAAFIALVMGR